MVFCNPVIKRDILTLTGGIESEGLLYRDTFISSLQVTVMEPAKTKTSILKIPCSRFGFGKAEILSLT